MAPKPEARSRPIDIALARPRPAVTVAIAITKQGETQFRYAAHSEESRWCGTVDAPSLDAALLDVIMRIRGESDADRIRFVQEIPRSSALWVRREEAHLLVPGIWIDQPGRSDESLLRQAHTALNVVTPAADGPDEPVHVATDGSVRGTVAGYGWLASTGEFGLQGYRHTTKLAGTKPALVTELRAIALAVQALSGRHITVWCDSQDAVAMANRWKAGSDELPPGYSSYRTSGRTPGLIRAQRVIHGHRDMLTIGWVKGHRGEPLNEGADALARLASRYSLGDSALDRAEYHRRAKELALTFSREFARQFQR